MMEPQYRIVLKALSFALIEIRAAETLRKAQVLADVFHNVPGGVAHGLPAVEIRKRLDETALRLGAREWVDSLFRSAERAVRPGDE